MCDAEVRLQYFRGLYKTTKLVNTQFFPHAGLIQDVLLELFSHFRAHQVGDAAGCHEFTATPKNFWIQSRECKRQEPVKVILHIPDSQMDWLFQGPGDFGQLVAGLGDFCICIQVSHDILEQICCIFCRLKTTKSTVFTRKISLTKLEKNGYLLALAESNKVSSLEDLFQ